MLESNIISLVYPEDQRLASGRRYETDGFANDQFYYTRHTNGRFN